MLDKLHLKTTLEVDIGKVKNSFPGLAFIEIPDSTFAKSYLVKKNNQHLLSIKTKPRWGHVSASHIQLNPSKWDCFAHLKNDLESITQISKLQICRIDHAVDVSVPIDQIHQGIRIKYKQNSRLFHEEDFKRDALTGFYIGSGHEIYCIYDKAYQVHGRKFKLDQNSEQHISTRIEVRHFKKKIAHTNFLDLPRYCSFSPFDRVEFLELNESSKYIQEKDALDTLIKSRGVRRIYCKLNKNNNFKRDYQKHFTAKPFNLFLNEKYWENLSQFFKEENK